MGVGQVFDKWLFDLCLLYTPFINYTKKVNER